MYNMKCCTDLWSLSIVSIYRWKSDKEKESATTAELPDSGLKSNAAILRFQKKMLSTGMIHGGNVCL